MVSPLTSYAEFLNYSRSDTNLNLAPARLVDAMDFRCREMYDKWERAKCESKVEVESRLMVKGQDMTERRGDDGGGGGGGGGCGCLECQRQPNKLKMIIVRIETQNNKHKLICGPNKRITYFAESTNNDKSNNSSNEGIEFVTDVGNVCLLCRQRVVGPCMNCWEHYAAATKCADDKNNANSSNSNNSSSSSNSRKCNSSSGGGNNKRSSHRRVCSIVCKRRKSDSDVAGVNSSWSWSYNSHRSRSNSSRSSSAESNYQVQHANAAAATTSAREKVEQFRLRTDCRISAASGDWPTRKEVATTPPTRATTRSFSVNELLPKGPLRAHNYNSHNHNYSSSPSSSCNVVSNNNSNNDNNDNIHYIHHNHDKKQHSKHRTPHHYCKHSSTSAAGTNSSYTFEQRDHITPTPTTPAPTTTVATNPTASETNGESVSAWGSPFASTLGTLQFLMIYTQMQLLRPLWKKFNNVCVGLRTQATATKCKFNKRQQRPPHKRLMKIRCNSYYDNATSNNSFNNNNNNNNNHNHHNNNNSNSNNNINNNNNTSHKQQSLLQQLLQPLIQQFHIQAVQQQYRIDDKRLAQKSHQHYRRHQHQQQQQQHHHRLGLTAPSQQEQQQLLQQYLRYFKMPNLSRLYKILIVLSFLSLFLPSTNAQASPALQTQLSATTTTTTTTSANKPKVILARNETVCRSMDLRNTPNEIRQLENCTVIEGFLLISLMNTHSTHTFNESFPLLTEVTEFVVIYRVYNLRTLAEIFPNLSIIRGRILFEGYALVVYSNPHLEELGLTKLTTIKRGGIRIENNINLCYVHTIDWSQIVSNVTDITIVKNRNPIECSKCPGDTKNDGNTDSGGLVCKESDGLRRCWNDKSCQKICPEKCRNNCIDENTCCNEACISGCSPTNLNACNICRHFSIFNSTCIDECPPNYFVYLDRRCITAEQCLAIGTKFENNKSEKIVPYNGTCLSQCPIGYNKVDLTCKKCNGKCVKKCVGGQIESVERAKEYQGCTHIITNGLVINIKRGGRHLMEELQHGLSSIQEISTFLKVQGTYGILSLSFFQNLKVIHGEKLMDNEYALYVLENYDLETIWGPNKTVEINNGRVFFHFNPKLCFSEIENLRKHMRLNQPFTKNEVARDSNGHKGSCNLELLNITITKITHRGAVVTILNPVNFPDERSFIGYQYLYMEDKYKNATKYSQGTCYDTWTVSDPSKEDTYMFFNLQPFTQYAVYVKTWTISSEPLNAQSEIQYFKTKSAQPQYVQTLNAYAKSSSEIVLTWTPPLNPHGNLIVYRVSAILDQRSQVVESRNYCKDPAQIDKEEDAKDMSRDTQVAVTDQPPNDSDCKCSKEPSSNHTEIDTKESIITDRIDFENTLQNFIYVKHTKDKNSSRLTDEDTGASLTDMDAERRRRRRHSEGDPLDSFLIRHMRAIPDDLEHKLLNNIDKLSGDNSGDNSITTIAPFEDSTNTSINDTRKDPTGKYYESFVFNVSVTTNKFVFTQLRHFSFYKVGVEACREREEGATKKECSDMRIQFVRTKKLDIVDKIQNLRAELDHTNTSRQSVRLYWDPPEEPNGAVVSYTISYIRDTTDAVEEKKCITDIDYRNLTNGYMLSGLHAGNYSIRIRANSLAGDGIYSEPVTVVIPPTQMSTMLIVILCVVGVVLVVGGGIVVYMLCKKMAPPSDLKIFPTVNPYYISLQYIPDEWEVARERVIQLSPLGQGSFGMVYEGILKGYNNSTEDTPCAIKTVNENATDRERMNFLNEASVMKQFDTYHVVRLLGVCSVGQPALVVMELMKHGDLKSYLRAHRPDERDGEGSMAFMRGEAVPMQAPPLSRIYQMAIEIADGMAYLAAKKFVHRDLAARNCMVAADLTVKIGDFGMTRDIYETDYYRKGTKGLLPVRWMPPESLRDGVYSTASDVFSYGVVLWEMVTLASQPYPGYSNDQVLRFVIEGGVMERPENCPDKIYELMQQCWEHRPSKRPSFLKIIRALLDLSEPHFREVSFYHSEEGQIEREKERTESNQNSGDVFNDENEMDDVTTPLRMGEYNDYKLNMGNNSSVENAGDSPMAIDDDQPHSPYSLASIIGSTPDGQSKNSFNLSQMSHNNPTLLSSVPSTSAGIISGGSHSHSHSQPHSQQRFPPHNQYSRQQNDQCAAYVQPDYDPNEDQAGATGQSVETDERGYELYDPSPNYREHAPYDPADDEEDFDGIGLSGRSGRQSGGQNLLPRHKAHQRAPIIMPMSSSMPDEIINAPPSSSLHPSTASAASSNASSTATTTGRYQILAKVLAETARLRNRRFFNHKRSGSNVSHKSTSSNPNTASYNSASNLTGATSGRDKSMSGQNLGTIESGGSGSAGSYAPRFFSPTSTTSTTLTTENPNYKLLDETANASCISAAGESATTSTPKKSTTTTKSQKPSSTAGYTTSANPNYQLLDETLNVTMTPTKPPTAATQAPKSAPSNAPYVGMLHTSENPNYEPMESPTQRSDNKPDYVMMMLDEPTYSMPHPQSLKSSNNSISFAHMSENPNYQMMGPQHSGHGTPVSSDDDCEPNEDDDDGGQLMGHIKMERIPLSRRRSNDRAQEQLKSRASRSRSQSQNKADEKAKTQSPTNTTSSYTSLSTTATTTAPSLTTASSGTTLATQSRPSTTYSLKEKWLRQQQAQPPPPPPNGFIGPEA